MICEFSKKNFNFPSFSEKMEFFESFYKSRDFGKSFLMFIEYQIKIYQGEFIISFHFHGNGAYFRDRHSLIGAHSKHFMAAYFPK